MSEGSAQAELTTTVVTGEVKVDEQQQQRIHKSSRASILVISVLMIPIIIIEVLVLQFILSPIVMAILTSSWSAFQPIPGWYPLLILSIYLLLAALAIVVSSPIFLFLGYILPRKYKLHRFTFSTWIDIWLRRVRYYTVYGLFMVEILFLLPVVQPNLWWLWMAILLALFASVRAYFAPFHVFNRVRRIPLTNEYLVNILKELCKTHKTSIQHFYLLESKKPGQLVRANAYLAGWGKTSSILLPDGLLKQFSQTEIRSIVAHELGHHVYRHLIKRQLLNFGLWLVEFFLYAVFYHWFLSLIFSTDSNSSVAIALLVMGFLAISLRLSCFMARKKYCRNNEFWADEFALLATLDVPAFKNAMVRLGNLNSIPLKLSPLMESCQTHPTTMRRLQHADEFAVRLARAREETNRT